MAKQDVALDGTRGSREINFVLSKKVTEASLRSAIAKGIEIPDPRPVVLEVFLQHEFSRSRYTVSTRVQLLAVSSVSIQRQGIYLVSNDTHGIAYLIWFQAFWSTYAEFESSKNDQRSQEHLVATSKTRKKLQLAQQYWESRQKNPLFRRGREGQRDEHDQI